SSHCTARSSRGSPVSPSFASISTTCAVTSALGGSITSPKSENASLRTSQRTLSASNAPQAPSFEAIPSSQRTARPAGAATSSADRRSASTTSAVSSVSGYQSFSNSNAQPPGGRSGRRTDQSPR